MGAKKGGEVEPRGEAVPKARQWKGEYSQHPNPLLALLPSYCPLCSLSLGLVTLLS